MRSTTKILSLLLLVLSVALVGCGGADKTAEKKSAEPFRIVTSFYPMYVATINITDGVDGVEVYNMTKPQTGCLHDYQLMTEDMKTLEKADAFVINGAGMEDFMDKVTEQQKKLKVIDASRGIELIHDDEGDNPHVWLSVTNEIAQVRNIADQLKEADPAHAEKYEKNAAAYIEKLTALKNEMHAALDNVPHKDIVTFHEAFPYFAKEFHLNIIGVVEREPGTEPTPTELQETIEQVNALPTKVLFTEPQYSPAAAETIARETGAKIYTLDPVVTGEATPAAKDAYIDTMKKNMKVLQEALQ
ncbi:metal ABC transporter substrate-binding protein [Selenomonas sp. oral taxon 126]|uniref:metal ABC transporter substrate-binding protein n=1 Tax=Selenomonas sp. oral taxon 126 TaxID=712528 RepID=UPI000807841B|nr:metal ABC transporter substrate-binding protein [Selenomonas sp. oral taxon 126]ANR71522.1 metal ABC transporter substrate-binding protein [Selenomonas sp. oral taxon 126]